MDHYIATKNPAHFFHWNWEHERYIIKELYVGNESDCRVLDPSNLLPILFRYVVDVSRVAVKIF